MVVGHELCSKMPSFVNMLRPGLLASKASPHQNVLLQYVIPSGWWTYRGDQWAEGWGKDVGGSGMKGEYEGRPAYWMGRKQAAQKLGEE